MISFRYERKERERQGRREGGGEGGGDNEGERGTEGERVRERKQGGRREGEGKRGSAERWREWKVKGMSAEGWEREIAVQPPPEVLLSADQVLLCTLHT